MKKSKWTVVLIASLLIAALVGFFIYKKIEKKSNYVEVKFVDGYNNEVLSTQELEVGKDAKVPEVPKHDGCNFTGWYTNDKVKVEDFTNVQKNLTVYANCDSLTFKVKFYDTIGRKVVDTQKVMYGKSAEVPEAPNHYGYNFVRWKGKYTNVKSNVTVEAIYAPQRAKYVVKYYTLDDDNNATLYTTKTFNSYVNRKVRANIMSIGGYQYESSYTANKLSGRVNIDNSLVLKLYYSSRTYSVTIDGETNYYEYKDSITLPELPDKTITLTYQEDDNVESKLSPNSVDLTLVGYCKNKKTCDKKDMFLPGQTISVTESAEYFPIWNMSMELLLPEASGYDLESEHYSFVSWLDDNNIEHSSGESFVFDEDTLLIATYANSSYDSNTKVSYVVNIYYDNELHSSVTEQGLIGKQIFGMKYADEVPGYKLTYHTDSIFLSSNTSENVIEIYYTNDELLIFGRTIEEEQDIINLEDNSEIVLEDVQEELIIEEQNEEEGLTTETELNTELNNEEIISESSEETVVNELDNEEVEVINKNEDSIFNEEVNTEIINEEDNEELIDNDISVDVKDDNQIITLNENEEVVIESEEDSIVNVNEFEINEDSISLEEDKKTDNKEELALDNMEKVEIKDPVLENETKLKEEKVIEQEDIRIVDSDNTEVSNLSIEQLNDIEGN